MVAKGADAQGRRGCVWWGVSNYGWVRPAAAPAAAHELYAKNGVLRTILAQRGLFPCELYAAAGNCVQFAREQRGWGVKGTTERRGWRSGA